MHYIENQNAKDIKALEQRHGPQVQMKRLSWNAFSLRHTLHKCGKVMGKAVSDGMKFLQIKRLCCICLKSGHHYCSSRSVCTISEPEKNKKKTASQSKSKARKAKYGSRKKYLKSTQYKENTITTTSNREINDEANTAAANKQLQ